MQALRRLRREHADAFWGTTRDIATLHATVGTATQPLGDVAVQVQSV